MVRHVLDTCGARRERRDVSCSERVGSYFLSQRSGNLMISAILGRSRDIAIAHVVTHADAFVDLHKYTYTGATVCAQACTVYRVNAIEWWRLRSSCARIST